MAVIAMFYGIIISMYCFDKRRHHNPHLHVKYQEQEAVIAIPSGEVLEGELKPSKLKLVHLFNNPTIQLFNYSRRAPPIRQEAASCR